MNCDYCNGVGSFDTNIGEIVDCIECDGSGMARCCNCPSEAVGESQNLAYVCDECIQLKWGV